MAKSSNSKTDRGTSQADQGVGRQPPSTRDSPIPGPTKPSKQPAKNTTNSDPPETGPVKGKRKGGAIARRPRGSNNPDRNPQPTSASPRDYNPSDPIVSRSDIQYIPTSTAVNRYIRGDFILPETLDEVELSQLIGIYDEMLTDPTIAGIRLWMIVNTLQDGVNFLPASPDGDALWSDQDKAEAIASKRYVSSAFHRLQFVDRPLYSTLWNLMDGARIPEKLAEITYDTMTSGEFVGRAGFSSITPKPRGNYRLVYDSMNRFRGVLAIVAGSSLAIFSGYVRDASKFPNVIASEKILMFNADDVDNVPKSLYAGAYAPWARILRMYRQMIETGEASAGGKVAVVLGDKAAQVFVDPVTGEQTTLELNTKSALSQWGNNGTLTLPNGSMPYVFFAQPGALQTFIEAIQMCKREMWTALTTNDKTGMEGNHGSGLSEDKSADNAEPVIDMLKTKLCMCLDKASYQLLKLDRGEEYAQRYCPKASMVKGDKGDFESGGPVLAQLKTAGFLTPSQYETACPLAGIKPPTPEEMTLIGNAWLTSINRAIEGVEPNNSPQTENADVKPNPNKKPKPNERPKQSSS